MTLTKKDGRYFFGSSDKRMLDQFQSLSRVYQVNTGMNAKQTTIATAMFNGITSCYGETSNVIEKTHSKLEKDIETETVRVLLSARHYD